MPGLKVNEDFELGAAQMEREGAARNAKPVKAGCYGMFPEENGCTMELDSYYHQESCEDCPRFGCLPGPGACCASCMIECCYKEQ